MSIFHTASVTCAKCGAANDVQWSASVNADLRPDLRAEILDGSFQATDCGSCGTRLRLPPHLTYLEMQRDMWIAAEATSRIEEWESIEDDIWKVYDRSFGTGAPKMVRDMSRMVRPRLVFGWAALREKLIAHDLGLDDIALEMLKMAVMRNMNGSPVSDETELRLAGGDAGALRLIWFHQVSEEALSEVMVPRDIYDGIAADPAWDAVRTRLTGVFWVDLRRFVMGAAAAA